MQLVNRAEESHQLHLIIDPEGNLVKVSFSSGNKGNRKGLRSLISGIYGKVFGDGGYISTELFKDLYAKGVQLVRRSGFIRE